jgi:hypothetical protein
VVLSIFSEVAGAELYPERTIMLPDLWIPGKPFEETQAHLSARRILQELAATGGRMRDLHWRQLEELVAELLHDMGLEIILTPRSSDGGRDVVVRGELIPGEPAVMAVEVKQMDVVPLSEVRDALWANRGFPALLVATAGRFSAGVIRESKWQDTRLRLILKDGAALSQWLDAYTRRNIRFPAVGHDINILPDLPGCECAFDYES